jgi:Fe-S-cluster-containing dehydrogenase component/CRP-like cAMP-binding protein
MPTEQTSRREIINAIKQLPSMASLLDEHEGHYAYELDLEVVVYGRNYNGKKVGPYVKLLDYQPGEIIFNEGDWGGNTFHVLVSGQVEVLKDNQKVAELRAGATFGQMSLLAGVPRNATIKTSANQAAQVLEIQRPALRLLRKLPKFGEELDEAYRKHGRDATVDELQAQFGFTPEWAVALKEHAQFRTFSKNHVLLREGAPVTRLYLIKSGWLRRTKKTAQGEVEAFLGSGYCFGLEALSDNTTWSETVTLLGRTEVFEISVVKLRQNTELGRALSSVLSKFAPPPLISPGKGLPPKVRKKTLRAQQDLIATGLVDATNLLVMDMDLCVRCGNCSMACHRIHGHSRLVRRGVHITRLKKPSLGAAQSVLSPEVCMHCQDPECLTGCPTGAIERLGNGQIDINPPTCIGCGDCATQCPYDAISMIPRAQTKPAPPPSGLKAKLRDLLRLAPDPLPPAVETLEDLVAVKCNLCNDRKTLNPPGSKTQKYSCEENCPTGALARIHPHQYFTEIGQLKGLFFTGPQQAIGRNIHLDDKPKRWLHALGILLTVVTSAVAVEGIRRYELGQPLVWILSMRWLTGLAGLFGIVGVMLYPYRRVIYTRRAGPLRYWLLTHAYLGVIATIQLLLHGGSDSGGLLTTALMISFDLVILTGLFGIFCYQVAPRLLTQIEGSPLLLDDLLKRRAELRQELAELSQTGAKHFDAVVRDQVKPELFSLGYLFRQYLKREPLEVLLRRTKRMFTKVTVEAREQTLGETLQRAGLETTLAEARVILAGGQPETTVLAAFAQPELRKKFKAALDEVRQGYRQVEQAITTAATLRRIDALIYLHRMLKLWLPPHVATTAVMLALMLVHIIQVIYFAAR